MLDLFRRTLNRNRLASTYLFVGDQGIGKRTTALTIAQALLCAETEDAQLEACGQCDSCQLLAAGNHPDLLQLSRPEGKANLPISLFLGGGDRRNREGLCHDIALKPYYGRRRIAIIDDADYLGVESGNCLLKTLEEPPPRALMVLIATSPQRVLPTTRSRSQVIRFSPLTEPQVAQVLERIGAADNLAAAEQLASGSGGSVSRALAKNDQLLRSLQPTIHAALTGVDFDPVGLAAQVQDLLGGTKIDAATRRRRLEGVLQLAIETLRSELRSPPPASTGAMPTSTTSTRRMSTLRRLDACLDAGEYLERNANQATLVQWWLDQLWAAAPARG